MQAPDTEETIDLREYIAILRARKWSILITAGVVIVATLAFSLQQTRLYTAEARLLVEQLPSSQDETLAPVVNLETERELVQSVTVAELVKEELDLEMPVDVLLDGLDVQVVTETEVLIIGYTSDDPAFSQQAANGFAQGYIDNRRNQALAEISAAQDDVQQSITRVNQQLTDVGQQLEELQNPDPLAAPDPNAAGSRVALESRQTTLLARLGVLQERFDSLSPGDTVRLGAGQVIAPATRPTSPSSPNLLRNALLAAFLGLALGIGLAFLKERLEDRFKGRDDVEQLLAAPLLATIPRFAIKSPNEDTAKLILRTEPTGLASESYRSLRTNLEFVASTTGRNSFLITSPSAGEGKSITTANLALAFAQSGRRTIIVSGDLRRPTIEKMFAIRANEGLSTFLAGQTGHLEPIIVNPGVANLRILPTGPVPPNPAELMTSPRLRELITDLEVACDVLLVDSAPTIPVADAAILGAHDVPVAFAAIPVRIDVAEESTAIAVDRDRRVGIENVGACRTCRYEWNDRGGHPCDNQELRSHPVRSAHWVPPLGPRHSPPYGRNRLANVRVTTYSHFKGICDTPRMSCDSPLRVFATHHLATALPSNGDFATHHLDLRQPVNPTSGSSND
ncbi:MAG: polysaccharide biosynthesis tyrosine autokinase [Actinomycetota bacterium]